MNKISSTIGIFCLLSVCGCTSLYLHDPQLETTSAAIKTDWESVGLSTAIESEKKNLGKLLEAEHSAIEQRFDAQLKFSLDRLLFENNFQSTYEEMYSDQVKRLIGNDNSIHDFGDDLSNIRIARLLQEDEIVDVNDILGQLVPEIGMVSCFNLGNHKLMDQLKLDISKLSEAKAKRANTFIPQLVGICGEIKSLDKKLDDLFGSTKGRLREAVNHRNVTSNSLIELKKQTAVLNSEYKNQLKEFNDLTSGNKSDGNKQKLQKLSVKLNDMIKDLNSIPGGFGEKIVAETRIAQLDDVIKTLAGEANDNATISASLKNKLAPLTLITSLKDDVDTAISESKKPLATPLLISKEHHKLSLSAAQARVKSKENALELEQDLVDSLILQVEVLLSSQRHYEEFLKQAELQKLDVNAPTISVISAAKQNRKKNINTRFHLYGAIVYLLDAIGRVDSQSHHIEQIIVANAHESALFQSDIAVKMWENLISQSIGQLAQYHKGGIKPENIAEYMQSLGIIWIGNGVN